MAYVNDILRAEGSFFSRFAAAFATWRAERRENEAKNRVYRNTVNELGALSRRDLDDIGIGAGDIETIAREAAYGK